MNQVAETIRIDSKLNFTHEIALRNSKADIKLSVNRLLSSQIVVGFFFSCKCMAAPGLCCYNDP